MENTGVGWVSRLFGRTADEALPLYQAIVAQARAPHWYVEGAVPDTVDGRFDMIAAVMAFVLLRLESEPEQAAISAQLAERFVDDMDSQLRQLGVGDVSVGKHIGQMMAMLGGRLGAYRDALAAGDLPPALERNLYRGTTPTAAAVRHVADRLMIFRESLSAMPAAAIGEGALP